MSDTRMTRRWGPFRQDWYSICSAHRNRRADCDLCQTGQWINVCGHILGGMVYKLHKPTWLWWVNRPNSKAKRFLRSVVCFVAEEFQIDRGRRWRSRWRCWCGCDCPDRTERLGNRNWSTHEGEDVPARSAVFQRLCAGHQLRVQGWVKFFQRRKFLSIMSVLAAHACLRLGVLGRGWTGRGLAHCCGCRRGASAEHIFEEIHRSSDQDDREYRQDHNVSLVIEAGLHCGAPFPADGAASRFVSVMFCGRSVAPARSQVVMRRRRLTKPPC